MQSVKLIGFLLVMLVSLLSSVISLSSAVAGIDLPHPGNDPCLKIHETGRRLEAIAKDCGVQLEFVALTGSWESYTARDMSLREDEVLAVWSEKLHTLLDESVMATSTREVVLRRIRSMNPKVHI